MSLSVKSHLKHSEIRENESITKKPSNLLLSQINVKRDYLELTMRKDYSDVGKNVYDNARHIGEALEGSANANKLVLHHFPNEHKPSNIGKNSSFSNSFMSLMFKDTSLIVKLIGYLGTFQIGLPLSS
jgi:hypothetical protein